MNLTSDIQYSIVEIAFVGLILQIVCLLVVSFYSKMLTGAEGIKRIENEDEELSVFYDITLKPRALSAIFFTNNLKSKYKKTQRVIDFRNFLIRLFWVYLTCFVVMLILHEFNP